MESLVFAIELRNHIQTRGPLLWRQSHMSDDENYEESEEHQEYCRQIGESGGFDVDFIPSPLLPGMIIPLFNFENDAELPVHSKLSLVHYNYLNDTNFEFVKVEKANVRTCSFYVHYITFLAKNVTDGIVRSFQSQVWARSRAVGRIRRVTVCSSRLKPAALTPGSANNTLSWMVRRKTEKDKRYLRCEHALTVFQSDEFKDLAKAKDYDIDTAQEPSDIFAPLPDSYSNSWFQTYCELILHETTLEKTGCSQRIYDWYEIKSVTMQTDEHDYNRSKPKRANFYIKFRVKNTLNNSVETLEALLRIHLNAQGYLCFQVKSAILQEDS